MVFLAITRKGYERYRALATAIAALWVSADVLSDNELAELREAGVNVSDFNYTIGLDETEGIAGAVETIKEHHPEEVIWVES
jgi:hypothetical protein